MKKVLLTTLFALSIFPLHSYAASGACSTHKGVNCAAGPDTDGSVICNDGWSDSSVSYSSMVMCQGYNAPTPTPPPPSEVYKYAPNTYQENSVVPTEPIKIPVKYIPPAPKEVDKPAVKAEIKPQVKTVPPTVKPKSTSTRLVATSTFQKPVPVKTPWFKKLFSK